MQQLATASPLRGAAVARALNARQAEAEAEVARILEGAYRLIRREGTLEPSVRELLAEVGLANRSFYRHFSSKDHFLLVMIEDTQQRLTESLGIRMAAQPTPVDRVRAWILGVLEQAADSEAATLGRPFLVHGPRLREAYPEVYRATGAAMLDLLEEAISAAVASRKMRSPKPRADARAIFHLTLSVMQAHVLDRTVPSDQEKQDVLDFALRAMR